MLRSLFVLTSVATVEASRAKIESHSALEAKWGASCDALQNRFHTQVQTCHTALNAANSAESMSTVSQGRILMRMYGLVRTMRRARRCAWVIENNSEDLEEMRGMTQQLIAENPCGEAARAEFEAGAADESLLAIARALSILASDNCEASEITEASESQEEQDTEGQMQDEIAACMDAEEEEGGVAFIQKSQAPFVGFMRSVGVFLLMLFVLLACTGTIALIGFMLGALASVMIGSTIAGGTVPFQQHTWGLAAGAVAVPFGLYSCTSQLYRSFLHSPGILIRGPDAGL